MNEEIIFRPARPEDCHDIARLFEMSSGGLARYAWRRLRNGSESLLDAGARRLAQGQGALSYRNCAVAVCDGTIAGMIHAYPTMVDGHPVDAGLVDVRDDPVLRPFGDLGVPDTFFVAGLATFPEYRGRGIGALLLALAEERASRLGLERISLIALASNEIAIRLCRRRGFAIVDRRTVVPHPLVPHTGDALLMVARVGADRVSDGALHENRIPDGTVVASSTG